MKLITIVLLLMTCWINGVAQNNPIFGGGNSDGWNKTNFQQAANNIFIGTEADGWSFASFNQSNSNIFAGGEGDGWNRSSFAQAASNIFNGGENDGWSFTSYLQAGNAIFNGGEGDGWYNTSFLQAGNNIFMGGEGDGWSSTYRPMGPLPVKFSYFTVAKLNETAALLKWETAQEFSSAHFEVQRSLDAMNFEKIGTVSAAGNSNLSISYSFTDYNPQPGLNYYRLKQVDKDAGFMYTPARVLRFTQQAENLVRYYPNPTSGILNIEINGEMLREAKLINISNASGIMMNQFKLPPGGSNIISVNLGNYSKGIYFIQVKTASSNSSHRVVLQ